LAARFWRLWRTSAWARADGAFVFRSCCLVGGCLRAERFARRFALVASTSVASASLRDGWARVGGWAGGNAGCSRYYVVVVVADVCGGRPAGLCMKVSVNVCLHVAGGVRCMGSCCCSLTLRRRRRRPFFFVFLFVVIELFMAALVACLCGWLIRSARHGTADNDDGHGDDATRLRVFGGRPPGRAQTVRSCLHLAARLQGVWVLDGLPGASCR
jgi:hypothetical protein